MSHFSEHKYTETQLPSQHTIPKELCPYLEFLLKFGDVRALRGDHDVVVFALLFGEETEPSLKWGLDDLAHTEREGAHKVVAGGAVPVPHLDE